MRARSAITWALFGCACSSGVGFQVPELPGIQAQLWLVQDGGSARLLANEGPVAVTAGRGSTLTLFGYNSPLETLGLSAGEIRLQDGGRLPPRPDVSLSATLDDEPIHFEPVLELEPVRDAARMAVEPLAECLANGGCSVGPEDQARSCGRPCPTIEEPLAPGPVHDVCPAGWRTLERPAETGVCLPPATINCAQGGAQAYASSVCTPIGPDCPAGDWPAGITGARVLYAHPTSTSGSGTSSSAPMSLSAALRTATASTVIALARGRFTLAGPETIPSGVQLQGACAESVVAGGFSGGPLFRVSGGDVALASLELVGESLIAISAGGALHTVDVTLTGTNVNPDRGIRLVDMVGGRLLAERTWLRTPSFFGIHAVGGSRVELRQVVFSGLEPYARAGLLHLADDSSAELIEVAVRKTYEGVIVIDSSLTGSKLSAEVVGGTALFAAGGSIELDDVALEQFAGEAESRRSMIAASRGARIGLSHLIADGDRLHPLVCLNAGDDSSPGTIDASSFWIETCSRAASAESHGLIKLKNGWVRDVLGAIESFDADLELDRVHIARTDSYGICTRNTGSLLGHDIRIENITSVTPLQCNIETAVGTGLSTPPFGTTQVERFLISGCDRQGLVISSALARFRQGTLARNAVGAYISPGVNLYDALQEVRFEANPSALDLSP